MALDLNLVRSAPVGDLGRTQVVEVLSGQVHPVRKY